jgi:hypothetical protein
MIVGQEPLRRSFGHTIWKVEPAALDFGRDIHETVQFAKEMAN